MFCKLHLAVTSHKLLIKSSSWSLPSLLNLMSSLDLVQEDVPNGVDSLLLPTSIVADLSVYDTLLFVAVRATDAGGADNLLTIR